MHLLAKKCALYLTAYTRRGTLVYYTTLSNLLIGLFFVIRSFGRVFMWNGDFFCAVFLSPFSWFAATIMIFVTYLIYNFLLLPAIKKDPELYGEAGNYKTFGNISVHYLVPLLSFANWLLFANKGLAQWSYAVFWIAIPLLYAVVIFIRGEFGKNIPGSDGKYPYEFMSPDKIGWKTVWMNMGILVAAFLVLGFVVIGLGKLLNLIF